MSFWFILHYYKISEIITVCVLKMNWLYMLPASSYSTLFFYIYLQFIYETVISTGYRATQCLGDIVSLCT
jgi:hypothetical protein